MPAQALAYKVGELHILQLRKKAQDTLKDSFDLKEFHDTILKNGAVPLSTLDIIFDAWINKKINNLEASNYNE